MNRPARTDFRTTMTRRRLLGGLSGLTVALTTPIWKSATAFAAAQPAKRFIGVFSANGTVPKDFWPPGTAADAPLTLGPILAPLEKYRQQMLVVGGVHMTSTIGANKPGGPHMKGPGAMLTGGTLLPGSFTGAGGPAGYADHMSVDQAIANRIGTMTKFPSLEFGVRIEGQEPLREISYRDANKPNKAVDDPSQIYTRMFADPTAGISPAQLAQLQAERKSVLDFLKDDLSRLSTKFTTSDRARLDSHLEGVRRIERQLGTSVQSCSMTMPAKIDPRAMANFPMIGKIQMDLMILALTCGMTNVATLMWANADSWQYFPWIGVNEEHHTMSHAGLNDALTMDKLTKINKWHAEQFAYMLDGLAAVSEPDGSKVLDNTLLLWGNEIGVGNTHTYMNIPWVIAGGTGGYFKMGRYLQYQNQPHNNLLISICHALGLQDVTTFGDPTLSTGPLPGLTA
ncbi:MAG TPA: DUF1552 domain-containing protein [Polyangia bacterium]|nr:DUF1552 domain-containing protein [Polyangia bacterium]